MNLHKLIAKTLSKEGELRASALARTAGVSRTYVKRILQKLCEDGQLVLIGKANQARYVSPEVRHVLAARRSLTTARRVLINRGLDEDKVLSEIKRSAGIFIGLPANITKILDYAFTEMLNNAIEHSKSKKITVLFSRQPQAVKFEVVDRGVGIFNNIRTQRKLKTTMEAIQDLLKGKQTTAPRRHTGEGIFFTSKVADVLAIQSSGKKLIFDNLIGDVFIRDIRPTKGTKVIFTIGFKSKRSLRQVFKDYSGEAYGFSKTKVAVRLYELGSEYISRSQARRVMAGLEKFKHITLDFKGVTIVGQGFADEVFRVWQNKHPNIDITFQNTNENVGFMIKWAHRSLVWVGY
ncbi:MAG: DUF4325 domain-containing protein [Candidatus Kerfeldbacteria bacterium]|nr:DUF4325 domain-containing protein [Candidatus Kerfeldbacteria bacterium]